MGPTERLIDRILREGSKLLNQVTLNIEALQSGLRHRKDPITAITHDQLLNCINDVTLERCRRCGNHIVSETDIGLTTICVECEAFFRAIDGDVYWFADMAERLEDVECGRLKV